MPCNFVPDAITYISCRQFNDLRQYSPEMHLKLRLCPNNTSYLRFFALTARNKGNIAATANN
jgi:hypothetical protein